MQQERLFVGATEAIHIQATYVVPEGWRLRVVSRRQGESWDDSQPAMYSCLDSPELLDVLCIESARALGLA